MPEANHADCVVIGGGVIGATIALRLAKRGLAVVLLDRTHPGQEASAAAAGILSPELELTGEGPFLELLGRSRLMFPELVAEVEADSGRDVGFRSSGLLSVAYSENEERELERHHGWQVAAGFPMERLSGAEVQALEPALAPCRMALSFPAVRQVDAEALAQAVPEAAARAGARIVLGEAKRIVRRGGRVEGVETTSGEWSAARVVVAAGTWSALIDGVELERKSVMPVRGQMVEFHAPEVALGHPVVGDEGYLVPRSEGRILCGSTLEAVGFRKQVTAPGLRLLLDRAARLCPALGEAVVRRSWAGLRPATADQLPLLGPAAVEGLYLATAHFRNGILLAPITAELVVASITGSRPPLDWLPFSPARLSAVQ